MSLAKFRNVFKIEITLSKANVAYKSDFTEAETVFWLEAVKDLIIKESFKNKI